MKRFIVRILIFVVLLAIYLAWQVITIDIHPSNYMQGYRLKCELLENTESPRIIFVGGSNLAFGLDSKRIEDSLKINVVNYGLHAGIGLIFMLDDVSGYVRQGDILVIAPEYNHFYESINIETFTYVQAIAHWKKLHLLDFYQWMKLMKGLPVLFAYTSPSSPHEGVYSYSSFNEYGDVVGHWGKEGKGDLIVIPKVIDVPFDKKFGKYFLRKVNELDEKCKVVVIPPICRETAYQVMKNNIDEIADFLEQGSHPFIVHPCEHVLPDEYAYDTDYHMNYKGVQKYTSFVIEELKPIVLDAACNLGKK